jgi:hypothetical protein
VKNRDLREFSAIIDEPPVDVAAAGHNIDELEEQHGAIAVYRHMPISSNHEERIQRPRPTEKRVATVPIDQIGQSIVILRDQRVLLDSDLAALHGVTTKRLNEQVKRNIDRFPTAAASLNAR